jgi:transposase-like protein
MKNAARSAAKETCWRERLQSQAESGISVRAFCRREGLSEPSFYSWRRELGKRDRQRAAGTKCLPTSSAAGSAGLVAVDVIGVLGEAMLEIAINGGVMIRLREEASAETLERVLSAACRQRVALENLGDSEAASC